jgi:energy-coupling factor transporter transmembrane protein EcfT
MFVLKKSFKVLFLIIGWILFPPFFVFSIFRNKNISNKGKRWAYFSVVISPFTLGFFALILILIFTYQSNSFSISDMEKSLNIKLDGDYKVSNNEIIRQESQDYNANISIKFTDESLKELVYQIEKSPYFNLKHDFYGNDEGMWEKSDTVFYWKVRDYLKENKMTGYWVKEDKYTYVFYEPLLSDIPNSSILFHEAYMINAELSLKDKILKYEYIKY